MGNTDNRSSLILAKAKAARNGLSALINQIETQGSNDADSLTSAISLCDSFIRTAKEPMEVILDLRSAIILSVTLNAVVHLGILKHMTAEGSPVHENDLATMVGVSPEIISSILKMIAMEDFVDEVEEGLWKMNDLSRALLQPTIEGTLSQMMSIGKTGAFFGQSLRSDTNAFELTYGKPVYALHAGDTVKAKNFGMIMEALGSSSGSISVLKDWIIQAGYSEGKFIDVGGGTGYICKPLAQEFPKIEFEVQDIVTTHFNLNGSHNPRLKFVKQDFFMPQPQHTTRVIAVYLRWILHNWNDEDAVKILRNVVPVMENDREARLLINEYILPEGRTLGKRGEKVLRNMDIMMLCSFGAKERTEKMWKNLLKQADERLEITRILWDKQEEALGLIEVRIR